MHRLIRTTDISLCPESQNPIYRQSHFTYTVPLKENNTLPVNTLQKRRMIANDPLKVLSNTRSTWLGGRLKPAVLLVNSRISLS